MGLVVKVLTKKGATVRAWKIIYEVVVQKLLLYGINIWVVAYEMLKVLEGFQHRVNSKIAKISAWQVG